jgi:hypothetical protein
MFREKLMTQPIELSFVDFRPDLAYKHLRKLKAKNSSGPDLLPALLFQNLACSLAFPLSLLFELFALSAVPGIWKTAIFTPIYKKDLHLMQLIIDQSH